MVNEPGAVVFRKSATESARRWSREGPHASTSRGESGLLASAGRNQGDAEALDAAHGQPRDTHAARRPAALALVAPAAAPDHPGRAPRRPTRVDARMSPGVVGVLVVPVVAPLPD